ncbi:MAG: 30S ribosomal protein S1 [Puniceicoccales bacterium]|jgi:small subunit ribosomal protein S1|nr:30S ribosomal protein S1 [Puniceicoccales bacterium]
MQHLMEELLSGGALAQLEEGRIVKGVITAVCQGEVMVDIGAKAEGKVRLSEFEDQGEVQPGQEIDVFLAKLEDSAGSPVLCYDRARQQKNWERIASTVEEGATVTGKITGKTRGGLNVSIGVDAFLPSSQVDVKQVKDVDEFIGRTLEFKVVKINYERRNIVLSRRELLEEDRWRKSREIFETIKVGDIVNGFVKNITDYGAFVDLDGVDGLLHVTDMSWGRVTHPNQVLRAGEELSVMVLDVDKDKERISLGLKQTMQNPWDNIEQRLPIGSCVRGKVVNVVPFGVFVEIFNGVEGLVHITEMSWTKISAKPTDLVRIGQEIDVVVIGVQKNEQKIALGMRQLEANPWDTVADEYPVGSTVHGVVQSMTAYGIFVEIVPGVHGMVHISDIWWGRKVKSLESLCSVGDVIDAVVLSVDAEGRRMSLGIKQLTENPWDSVGDKFKVGDRATVRVIRVIRHGAVAELAKGLDCIIPNDQANGEGDTPFAVDQELEVRILEIDAANERIIASAKASAYDDSQFDDAVSAMRRDGAETGGFGNISHLFQ